MKNFKNIQKYEDALAPYRHKCKCGHTIIITETFKGDYIVCRWCGRKTYKNKEIEDRYKFKEKLEKRIKNV